MTLLICPDHPRPSWCIFKQITLITVGRRYATRQFLCYWWVLLPTGITLHASYNHDTENCAFRMRRECLEHTPRHRLQRTPLVIDPDMHHGTGVTHVPWCMSGSLTSGILSRENVPGIPGACATHTFTYLVSGPCTVRFNGYARCSHLLHDAVVWLQSLLPVSIRVTS